MLPTRRKFLEDGGILRRKQAEPPKIGGAEKDEAQPLPSLRENPQNPKLNGSRRLAFDEAQGGRPLAFFVQPTAANAIAPDRIRGGTSASSPAAKSALAGFHPGVFLVDDVDAPTTADNATIFVADLCRFEAVANFHKTGPGSAIGGAVNTHRSKTCQPPGRSKPRQSNSVSTYLAGSVPIAWGWWRCAGPAGICSMSPGPASTV